MQPTHRETHEALIDNYRGNLGNGNMDHDYNWFDPKGQFYCSFSPHFSDYLIKVAFAEFANDDWWCFPNVCSPPECCIDTPFDPIGHGTHVAGTAVGSEKFGIGVAPGAKFIAAKGCRDGQCLNFGLISR